jgi:hypothetical protein
MPIQTEKKWEKNLLHQTKIKKKIRLAKKTVSIQFFTNKSQNKS